MTSYSAITIWQPWASLIAIGAKRFEFRKWAPPASMVGERIAIHAGTHKVNTQDVQSLLYALRHPRAFAQTGLTPALATPLLEQALTAPGCLPLGCILALATLGRPVRDAELAADLGISWNPENGPDEHTNYGWPLSDIAPIEPPVPARGAQGFWTWRQA